MVSGDYTFLLQHVIKMRRSCFDTDFVSQIKLAKLPLIHCFGSNLKIVKCIKMYYFTRKQGRPKKKNQSCSVFFSNTSRLWNFGNPTIFFVSLVPTHVVCERLSVMHYTFQLPEILVHNSLSSPTQVFQECWSGVPPPPNENLDRSWHFELIWSTPPLKMKIWADLGSLSLSWSGVPPPPQMKIWPDLGTLSLSWSEVPPISLTLWYTSGGSKGGARDARPPRVKILLFSCSFRPKKLVSTPTLGVGAPPGENPRSATVHDW